MTNDSLIEKLEHLKSPWGGTTPWQEGYLKAVDKAIAIIRQHFASPDAVACPSSVSDKTACLSETGDSDRQSEICLKMHPAVLEDIIRGVLEGLGSQNCDAPITCANQIMLMLKSLPATPVPVSIKDVAWKMALKDLREEPDNLIASTKLALAGNKYRNWAILALDAAGVPYVE